MTLQEKFDGLVEKTAHHWLWRGTIGHHGYPQIWWAGRNLYAHRVAYELRFGAIPEGKEIDHTCRYKHCVLHLEAVTHLVNVRRSRSGNRKKTHCPQGHPYDRENTYRWHGTRICRTCRRERQNAAKAA